MQPQDKDKLGDGGRIGRQKSTYSIDFLCCAEKLVNSLECGIPILNKCFVAE